MVVLPLSRSPSLSFSLAFSLYNSRSLALFPSPSLPPSLSISLYLLSRSLSLSRFLTYNSLNSLTLSFSLAFSLAFSLSLFSLCFTDRNSFRSGIAHRVQVPIMTHLVYTGIFQKVYMDVNSVHHLSICHTVLSLSQAG